MAPLASPESSVLPARNDFPRCPEFVRGLRLKLCEVGMLRQLAVSWRRRGQIFRSNSAMPTGRLRVCTE